MKTGPRWIALLGLAAVLWAGAGTPPAAAAIDRFSPYSLGTGPVGGFAIDPSRPATLLVGLKLYGVYRSVDDGATWAWSSPGLGSDGEMQGLAADPGAPGIFYAATLLRRAVSIFRSTDGGASWSRLFLSPSYPNGSDIERVRLFLLPGASGAPSSLYFTLNDQLWTSADGGASWFVAFVAPAAITALATPAGTSAPLALGTRDGGILTSADAGATWTARTALPGAVSGASVLALALAPMPAAPAAPAPAGPATLYASLGTGGAYKSADDGLTWTPLHLGPPAAGTVTALAVDPARPQTVYASDADFSTFRLAHVRVSLDGGATWTLRDRGITDFAIQAFTRDPARGGFYAVGQYSDLARSVAGGWQALLLAGQSAGLGKVRFQPGHPSEVYVVNDFRLFASADAGRTWTTPPGRRRDTGASVQIFDLIFDPRRPSLLYGIDYPGGVVASDDGGATWTLLASRPSFLSSLAAPRPGVLVAGGCGLFQSTDSGRTFRTVLSCNPSPGVFREVARLVSDPAHPETIYAEVSQSQPGSVSPLRPIYRTQDGGTTWRRVITRGQALALDRTHPGTLYVVVDQTLLRSADSGRTWRVIGALSGAPIEVFDLLVDPDLPTTLYAGTGTVGVLRSRDGGRTWAPVNAGLPGVSGGPTIPIIELAADPQVPHRIYAFDTGSFFSARFTEP
jgi:photosystem II stability/assembly factor-like uncharacterized protein